MDVITIDSPTVPEAAPIFQVTLENGAVLTRAYEFAGEIDVVQRLPLVAETGKVLVSPTAA